MPLPQLNPKRKVAFVIGLVLETLAAYGFIALNEGAFFMILAWGVATILTFFASLCFVIAFSTIRISKILLGAAVTVGILYGVYFLLGFIY